MQTILLAKPNFPTTGPDNIGVHISGNHLPAKRKR